MTTINNADYGRWGVFILNGQAVIFDNVRDAIALQEYLESRGVESTLKVGVNFGSGWYEPKN